jgi:hypothetical protein
MVIIGNSIFISRSPRKYIQLSLKYRKYSYRDRLASFSFHFSYVQYVQIVSLEMAP